MARLGASLAGIPVSYNTISIAANSAGNKLSNGNFEVLTDPPGTAGAGDLFADWTSEFGSGGALQAGQEVTVSKIAYSGQRAALLDNYNTGQLIFQNDVTGLVSSNIYRVRVRMKAVPATHANGDPGNPTPDDIPTSFPDPGHLPMVIIKQIGQSDYEVPFNTSMLSGWHTVDFNHTSFGGGWTVKIKIWRPSTMGAYYRVLIDNVKVNLYAIGGGGGGGGG